MPDSLDEWEKRLRPQVAEVDLLGDVALSEDEVRLLGRLIGDLVRREEWTRAAHLLREQYPCSYAVFLVAQGARRYEAGDFWSAVRDATGLPIPPAQTLQWGQLFEEIVQALPVIQFPPLGGLRYVGPILAHSGIPDYCLGDFFDHFLQPLVTRPEFAVLSTEEFIQQRLRQASMVYVADKPVLRFLEHGGPLAVDFVERCREMAIHWAERGEIPSPEEVGLPPRVVQRYQDWLEGRAPTPQRRAAYRSPVLFLDPWGWGPCLHLPSQPLPATELGNIGIELFWQVSPGDTPKIPVDFRQDDLTWKTVPLSYPAPEYQVALAMMWTHERGERDGMPLREWRIPGIRAESPLMWFDPRGGRQIFPRDTLPAGRWWVLRSPDVILEADPPGSLQVTEQFPRMPGKWSDFIGEEVDLSLASHLTVRQRDRQIQQYAVVGTGPESRPSLVGDNRLPVEDGRPPLYIGAPPALRIPLSAYDQARLHRWHVKIWNERTALPEVRVSGTLANLQPDMEAGAAVLDLQTWLGERPIGTYTVKVRGPLGHKADLAFRILPVLEIVGHERLYLPGEAGEACLLVETDAHTELALQPGATDSQVTLQEEDGRRRFYEVTAGVSRADFPLRFARRTDRDDSVDVPVSVPIRRLRWMIVLSREQGLAPEWRTDPLRLPLDALEQAREPFLLVDLFGGASENLEVTLSLQDEDGAVLQEQEGRWRAGQSPIRFDLTAFLDTLRRSSSLLATFRLNLSGLPDRGRASFPALQVTRHFTVQWAQVESEQIGDTVYLRLRWEATVQVRHRLARLWPVWRPWEPPLEIPIPDTTQDEHRCTFPAAQLIPGRYLLEITTRDPWATETGPPTRPAAEGAALFPALIPPDAVARRLQTLRDQALRTGLTFPISLETACIRRDVGQDALAQEAFQWCFEHLDEAEIEHILALVCQVTGNPDLDRPLRMKLAAAQQVGRVLEEFRQGRLPESLYQEYLAQLPHPSLWSPEACEVLLNADDDRIRFQAIQQLVEREDPGGIHALLQGLEEGRISDEDAIALVKQHLRWAVERLTEALRHPAALRLLEKLERRYLGRVPVTRARPGHWVRCVAGWGRLERIEAADGTQHAEFLTASPEPGLRLHVLLRAQDPKRSEKIVIHLEEGTVHFPGAKGVYRCTKCDRFASQDYTRVTEEHDRAVHGGVGPGFKSDRPTLPQTAPLEFRSSPPPQPWE
ncbi:MAG: hypothetical protein ACPLTQ_01050 [Anaerolineae bacterium]